MKKIFTIFVFTMVLMSIVFVGAKIDKFQKDVNDHSQAFVPEHAVDLGNGVFSLGTALDVDGREVQGYMHVYKKGNARPPWAGGGDKKGSSTCYSYFAKGARWKETENYTFEVGIDPVMMEASMKSWEDEEGTEFEIFGSLDSVNETYEADFNSPDGLNEVMHDNLGNTGTIAYTITWGVFGGPPSMRELIEWDMVFNSDFDFGDGLENSSVMDYQNIATHELGHALGLGHPDNTCTEETMYAYATTGETKKRTLNAGDIEGVMKLY